MSGNFDETMGQGFVPSPPAQTPTPQYPAPTTVPPAPVIEPQAGSLPPVQGGGPFGGMTAGEGAVVTSDATIATWPAPVVENGQDIPISMRTGEPVRPPTLLIAVAACWTSAACTVAAFIMWWWQATHIATFGSSARLLAWTHPDPVSALAIVMVILIGIIALLMVAAAGTVAYNTWTGERWIQIGALVCLAVTGLSFLLTWWFSVAMIPLAVGALLLWVPRVSQFFVQMDEFRASPTIEVPTFGIRYGIQPLIGHRG